jgi:hypothetical protein
MVLGSTARRKSVTTCKIDGGGLTESWDCRKSACRKMSPHHRIIALLSEVRDSRSIHTNMCSA